MGVGGTCNDCWSCPKGFQNMQKERQTVETQIRLLRSGSALFARTSICPTSKDFYGIANQRRLSRLMTKPTKLPVGPAKTRISLGIRLDWSESTLFAWRNLSPWLSLECTANALIRLDGYPGWSESSLVAQSLCWFCGVQAHYSWACNFRICFGTVMILSFRTARSRQTVEPSYQALHCLLFRLHPLT